MKQSSHLLWLYTINELMKIIDAYQSFFPLPFLGGFFSLTFYFYPDFSFSFSAFYAFSAFFPFLHPLHSSAKRYKIAPITPKECQRGALSRRAIVGTWQKTPWCYTHNKVKSPKRVVSLNSEHLDTRLSTDEASKPATTSLRYCKR